MDKAIAQFQLEEGSDITVLFSVPNPKKGNALEEAADVGQLVYRAKQTLGEALEVVQPVAETIMSRFIGGLTTPAKEVEVKFGLTLTAEAGAIFTSIGGDVTFEITLKWENQNSNRSINPSVDVVSPPGN
jgi:hypothetical protein